MGLTFSKKKQYQNYSKEFKNFNFYYYLLIKHALKSILHRKIIHKIISRYLIPIMQIRIETKEQLLHFEDICKGILKKKILCVSFIWEVFDEKMILNYAKRQIYQKAIKDGFKHLELIQDLSIQYKQRVKWFDNNTFSEELKYMGNVKTFTILCERNFNNNFRNFKILCKNIKHMKFLKELNIILTNNQICPLDDLKQLTLLLPQFKNLQILCLDFRRNELEERQIVQFANSLQNLKGIYRLYLNFSNSTPQENLGTFLTNNLVQLTKLRDLDLQIGNTEFMGAGIVKFSQNLENLTQVRKLNLNLKGCGISSQKLMYIAAGLSPMVSLECLTLNLQGNKIESEGMEHIKAIIESLQRLKYLDLNMQRNKIKSLGVQILAEGLSSRKSMYTLKICLADAGIKMNLGVCQLFNTVAQFDSLNCLEILLGGNQLSWEIMRNFEQVLEVQRDIKHVYFDVENNFRMKDLDDFKLVSCISRGLNYLYELKSLQVNMGSCEMKDKDMEELFQNLKVFQDLQRINLCFNFNEFGNDGIMYMSEFLTRQKNQKQKKLQYIECELTGNNYDEEGKKIIKQMEIVE